MSVCVFGGRGVKVALKRTGIVLGVAVQIWKISFLFIFGKN